MKIEHEANIDRNKITITR